MDIYIVNPALDIIGVIDNADSVLWNKKYNDIGEAEIYVPCTDEYIALLRKGNFLYRFDDDMCCKIEKVVIETDEENGDYIIATAYDICKLLSGRIIRYNLMRSNENVTWFIAELLSANVISPNESQRKIPNFEIDGSEFGKLTDKIDIQTKTDDLLEIIISACKTCNYGFRVSLNLTSKQYVFRLYQGVNKATMASEQYVEFSSNFANIISSNYKEDSSNFKNVVYVSYKGYDGDIYLLSMYKGSSEPQGEARKEIYVDGSGQSRDISYGDLQYMFGGNVQKMSKDDGDKVKSVYYIYVDDVATDVAYSEGEGDNEKIQVSDYTYLILIRAIGAAKLAECTETQEFSGVVDTVDTYKYKTDYNLGDIVKVANDYGIEAEARIVAVLESEDNEDGYAVEPTFEYIS